MNNLTRPRGVRLLAGAALMLFASLSHAQYVWVDEKGLKQFSDRPPPPSTPRSKIIKAPGLPVDVPVVDAPAATEAPAPAASKAKGPPTLADRNNDFRKRAKEQAEREQKAASEAQHKADLAENCEAARSAKAMIDSGVRIASTDKNGERSFLSDDERAQRSARAEKVLQGCR